ncbi:MAG: YlmH/Sll1252 family protein [Candidatus Limivicinus sp.]|nr:YlmH/Sll1252 family protein [Candidatus Limivicinus sp.]
MENSELLKRARDLAERCERSGTVCVSGFLSPAEQHELQTRLGYIPCGLVFHGGGENCERAAAFFLPDYMTEEMLDVSEYLCAMKLKAYFGQPGHRDYMGALLGMGIGREWLGDIQVEGDTAYVFCMKSVLRHLLSIEKAGRYTVKASQVPLEEVPARKVETESLSFSVMSPRLDAVAAGLFHLSRTEAAKQIAAGNVSLNYAQCLKADCIVKEGDILSLKGKGKGSISGMGGTSRKGRLFVYGEIYK